MVRGEPGIGKSALLEAAAALARAQGISVLMTTAVESESRLPFAGLPELLLPFLDRLVGFGKFNGTHWRSARRAEAF